MFTVMKDDLNKVMFQSQILAEELTRQTIENHSTETIEFNLIFFTSAQIPKSPEKRDLPYDKRVICQRVVNSRDTCKFIYENLNELFVENSRINDFLNKVERILDVQSSHQSVRNLEVMWRVIARNLSLKSRLEIRIASSS